MGALGQLVRSSSRSPSQHGGGAGAVLPPAWPASNIRDCWKHKPVCLRSGHPVRAGTGLSLGVRGNRVWPGQGGRLSGFAASAQPSTGRTSTGSGPRGPRCTDRRAAGAGRGPRVDTAQRTRVPGGLAPLPTPGTVSSDMGHGEAARSGAAGEEVGRRDPGTGRGGSGSALSRVGGSPR